MARPLRVEFDGAIFHVTARGNERRAIVRDDGDRNCWLEWLGRVVERYRLDLFSFALLDNHYHLFLETPHGGLSAAMQTLNGSYTSYFNRRHGRVGHLFQGRFKGILVESEGHYAELSRYVHLNPVRAGLVGRPEDYVWSSFRGYFRASWALEWVDYGRVLSEFGSHTGHARRAYRGFVEDGLGQAMESPLRDAVHGLILGGEEFVSKIKSFVQGRKDDGALPELRALRSYPGLDGIVAEVARAYGLGREEVVRPGRGRTEPRNVAMYLARECAGIRLKEIGEHFGGLSQASVSLCAKRVREKIHKDRRLSRRIGDVRRTLSKT